MLSPFYYGLDVFVAGTSYQRLEMKLMIRLSDDLMVMLMLLMMRRIMRRLLHLAVILMIRLQL